FLAIAEEQQNAAGLKLFRERIEPVLQQQCYRCHSAEAALIEGGLRLDGRVLARRGGDSGPAVVSGKPNESLLVRALRHEGGFEMPPEQPKLAAATIAHFVRWIELGAPDPREDSLETAEKWPEAMKRHWAFQPIPPVLATTRPAGSGPLDSFIQAKLAQ